MNWLFAVKDVTMMVNDEDYGRLNKLGINPIRCFSGRGIRVAGAPHLVAKRRQLMA